MPRILLAILLLVLMVRPALAISVVFINPGHADEVFWRTVSRAMHDAADSLGMALEVLYAGRDHTGGLRLVHEVVARARHPDYLIVTNDYGSAPAMLRAIEPAAIPTLLAFSGIHGDERALTGGPRERFRFWLGSVEPRAADAGYLTARRLLDAARVRGDLAAADGRLHLLAVAGDRSTPSSIERTRGLRRAVDETPDAVLDQLVHGDWNRAKAAEQARWLYARHPHARLVWAGNDEMAFGAMQAWRERDGRPGGDALFSGINTSDEALEAIRSGELAALAGGHFLTGAWALVMVHDHARGRDFRDEGLELEFPLFELLDPPLARRFERLFGPDAPRLDYRRHSKALNPRMKTYDFDFARMLR